MSLFGSWQGNLAASGYFLVFQAAGITLAGVYLQKETRACSLVIGSVLGNVLLQWLPALFAFAFSFGREAHLAALFTAGLIICVFGRMYARRGKCPSGKTAPVYGTVMDTVLANKGFSVFFLLLAVLWCCLLYTHNIRFTADGSIHTGQCDYGDLSMHLGFASGIAAQGKFPPDYSIFPGRLLAYPFLSDSLSSSLYLCGASLRWAYSLPMIPAFLQVVCLVYLLAGRILKDAKKALLAGIFFFLNGGLGFVYFLHLNPSGGLTLKDIFTGYYTTPTNLISHGIRWVNVIADMLLPQRATLFGYAVLFAAVFLLYEAVFTEKKKYFLLLGCLAGSLPMIHTHSFLALGIISGTCLLIWLVRRTGPAGPGSRKISAKAVTAAFLLLMSLLQVLLKGKLLKEEMLLPFALFLAAAFTAVIAVLCIRYILRGGLKELMLTWGVYAGLVLLLAIPQLIGFTFRQASAAGFVRGHFNWGNEGEPYLWFYLKNLGVVFPAALTAVFFPHILSGKGKTVQQAGAAGVVPKESSSMSWAFPALVLWTFAELVAFSPNSYDNNKLLYPAWLLICILAADFAGDFIRKRLLFAAFMTAACLSAVLTLGREAVSDIQLYEKTQVDLALWAEKNTPPDSVFLTSDRHNNTVTSLSGRSIVCGSGVFLYFHGIDILERSEDVRRMFEEPEMSRDLFEKYGVSCICVSPYERESYQVNEAWFEGNCEEAFSSEGTRLFKLIG